MPRSFYIRNHMEVRTEDANGTPYAQLGILEPKYKPAPKNPPPPMFTDTTTTTKM